MIITPYPQYFESNRLKMRLLNLDDTIIWSQFLADERTTKHFPEYMRNKDYLHALTWIEKQICRYRDKKGGLMALIEKDSGRFVGQSGLLVQTINGIEELEVGYHLLPEFWGKGYATEAAQFFKNLAFEISDVSSVISNIEISNFLSQAVATRNGLQNSGQFTWHDLEVFIYRIEREKVK
jgi:RimJ/RimL family protein N-acetyltransferase